MPQWRPRLVVATTLLLLLAASLGGWLNAFYLDW
jgi:hypothetical protein